MKRRALLAAASACLVSGAAVPAAHADWSFPKAVAEAQLTTAPLVDINEGGDALVSFNRETEVRTRWRFANGTDGTLRGPITGGLPVNYAIATFPDSDGVIAWEIGETLYARTLPEGSGPLGNVREISFGGEIVRGPVVETDGTGQATIAWVEQTGGQSRIYVRRLSKTGELTGAQSLAEYNVPINVIALAVNQAGTTAVGWLPAGKGVRLRVRQPAQTWAQTPFVQAAGVGVSADQLTIDVDAAGNTGAAWRAAVTGQPLQKTVDQILVPANGSAPTGTNVDTLTLPSVGATDGRIASAIGPASSLYTLYDDPQGSTHRFTLNVRQTNGSTSNTVVGTNTQSGTRLDLEVDGNGQAFMGWRQNSPPNCSFGCHGVETRLRSGGGVLGPIQPFGGSFGGDEWDIAQAESGPAAVAFHDVNDLDFAAVRLSVNLTPSVPAAE